MIRTTTLLFTAALTSFVSAQDWTVGLPVDMLLYTQTFYGGCNPNADYTFTFPVSAVAGVDYLVKVTEIQPPAGSLDILPGLVGGGLGDELVFDAAVQRSLILAPGTTSATLEFRAIGAPTQSGDQHPCAPSQFWLSNLGICPDGLIPTLSNGCSVQAGSTSVGEGSIPEPLFQWPSPLNGQHLSISLPANETATVNIIDASGRTNISKKIGYSGVLDLSTVPEGAYVMDLVRSTGSVITRRFLVSQ